MFNQMHLGPFADDVLVDNPQVEVAARRIHGEVCRTHGYLNPGFDNISSQSQAYYRDIALL